MIDKLKIAAAVVIVIAGVVAYYYLSDYSPLVRVGAVLASVVIGLLVALSSAPGQAAWEFAKGSRLEVRKVVWPTRRETAQATLSVILLVIAVGVMIWVIDVLLYWVVYDLVLGTARH